MKNELFVCKFKEKHKEGLQDRNKVKDFDTKYVAIDIENLHLKSEIDGLKKSNEEKLKSIKKLEAELLELESNQSDSLEFEECEDNIMVKSTAQLECEFYEYSLCNKKDLEKHISEKHLSTLLTDINKQKSKLFYSLQKLNNKERKSRSIHKCKQPCLIYHQRFSFTKHKSQQMLEKLMEISYPELEESRRFDEDECITNLTFLNPSVQS